MHLLHLWINKINVKIQPTGDFELEAVPRWIGGQRDPEASSGEERRQYVAHDVDLNLFLALKLLPDDWVVEHAKFFCVELTVKVDGLAGVEHMNLTLCPHGQEHANSCQTCRYVHYNAIPTAAIRSRL